MANQGSVVPKKRTGASPPRLCRLEGSAKPTGFEFEYKVAGLVALRARNAGLRFELYSNVRAARPCDDLVLRLLGPPAAVCFVQLKHSDGKSKRVGEQALIAEKGDFSLRKYFDFYEEYSKMYQNRLSEADADKRLLTEYELKDAWFLLYTTKDVAHSKISNRGLGTDANGIFGIVKDLFLSASKGQQQVFSFSHGDQKVWNLFRDDPRAEIYQNEFLPHLMVFSRQSHADYLDDLIRLEIESPFGGKLPNSNLFLEEYLAFLKSWTQDPLQGYCLRESTPELQMERLLAAGFRKKAKEAASGLQFQKVHCIELRAALANNRHLRVSVPGVAPGLRAAQLQQILEGDFPDNWVYVDVQILKEYSTEALVAVCRACEVLLLEDCVEEQCRAQELVKLVDGLCSVVVLCSGSRGGGWSLLADAPFLEEAWRMSFLTETSQEGMLDRELSFQGRRLKLRALEDTWPQLRDQCDAPLLCALARGVATLGAAPPAPDDDAFHIPRTLEHGHALSLSALSVRNPMVHLVLDGFPEGLLKEIAQQFGISEVERNDMWSILLPAGCGDAFDAICAKHSDRSVHWIEFVASDDSNTDGTIIWKLCHGSPDSLASFVVSAKASCARRPVCSHVGPAAARDAASWTQRVALLAGEAGAGKSCFLRRVAAEARADAPQRWVVLVEVLAQRALLREMREARVLDVTDAVDLVAAAAGIEDPAPTAASARRCLEAALLQSGNVQVYVDGVDEVCPVYKDKVMRVIQLLTEETKASLIWVSTRPEVETPLRRALRCTPSRLRSLSRAEQERFLRERWAEKTGAAPEQLASLAAETVAHLARAAGGGRSLLAAPLHLHMAAEALGRRLPPGGAISLIDLHELFARQMLQRFKKRHGLEDANLENTLLSDVEDRFYHTHETCAMYLLTSDGSWEGAAAGWERRLQKLKDKDGVLKEKGGLLWAGDDGGPHFAHFSFAEFFAARWLRRHAAHDGDGGEEARAVLRGLFGRKSHGGLLRFVELMLVQESEAAGDRLSLHRAVLEGDETALAAALEGGGSVIAEDAGGRLALHLAASRGLRRTVAALLADDSGKAARRDALLEWTPLDYAVATMAGAGPTGTWRGPGEWLGTVQELLQADPGQLETVATVLEKATLTQWRKTAVALDLPKATLWLLVQSDSCHYRECLEEAARTDRAAVARAVLQDGGSLCAARGSSHQQLHRRESERALRLAAASGNAGAVRALLEGGCDASAATRRRGTPLHCALREGASPACVSPGARTAVVAVLLEFKADPNQRDKTGKTPLHLACEHRNEEAVRQLLAARASVTLKDERENSPLFYAIKEYLKVDESLVEEEERRGTDCDGAKETSKESQQSNVFTNEEEIERCASIVLLLLRSYDGSTKVNLHNKGLFLSSGFEHRGNGVTKETEVKRQHFNNTHHNTLHDHISSKRLSTSKERLNSLRKRKPSYIYADFQLESPYGVPQLQDSSTLVVRVSPINEQHGTRRRSALHAAASRGHAELAEQLLLHDARPLRDSNRATALHLAAAASHCEIVWLLVDKSFDPNALNHRRSTALHYAAQSACATCANLLLLAANGRWILAHTADINGDIPLHLAARVGATDVAKLLVHHTELVDLPNAGWSTPLHLAAAEGYSEVVDILLRCGCSPSALDILRRQPLHNALRGEEYRWYQDEEARSKRDKIAALLLRRGADADHADANGVRPLHLAAATGNEVTALRLLQARVDPNARDDRGRSPLHYAAEGVYGAGRVTALLLRYNADPSVTDLEGKVPLHLAAEGGREDVLKRLIEAGADVELKDARGRTALHLAAQGCHQLSVKALLECGACVSAEDATGRRALDYVTAGAVDDWDRTEAARSIEDVLLRYAAEMGKI